MSKTPRTDAELKFEAFFDGAGIVETVLVEFAEQLETELADKDKQLAEARDEIERLRARNAILDNAIAEMTEEQAVLCAEDQGITELVAAKDALIEQMRTTLIAARNGMLIACDDDPNNSRVKRFFDYIDSALAAERGE